MGQALSWFVLALAICLGAMLFTVVSRKTENFADVGEFDADMDLPQSNAEPDLEDLTPVDPVVHGGMEGEDVAEMEDEDEDVAPFVGEEFTPYS